MIRYLATVMVVLVGVWAGSVVEAEEMNLGLGVYPGDPTEDFSPTLVSAPGGRRNLALNRAASQSSAYDYNLAAQLVTEVVNSPGSVPPSKSCE